MKTTGWITLGALIGTCSFAVAQEKPKHPDGPRHELPPEVIAGFDKDGDGKLSEQERKAMREEMKAKMDGRKAEMLKKFDTNGDGKLDETERAAMKAEREAMHKALVEKYDTNKDGKLDPEEAKAARAAGEKMGPRGGPDGPHGRGGKGKLGGTLPAAPAE